MSQNDERSVELRRVSSFQYVKGETIGWTMDVVLGYSPWQWQWWEVARRRHGKDRWS